MKNFYRNYFSKTHLLLIPAVLITLLVQQSCKKKGDEVSIEIIEEKLAGEESITWEVPFSILSCGEPQVQKLTLYRDHRYTYSESPGCEQSGTWKAEYFANRAGQHVRIEFHHSDEYFSPIELRYSNSSGTFYYLHNQKGLVELIRLREVSWVSVDNILSQLETHNLAGRVGMVSVEYNGKVYFGMGDDPYDEEPPFNDWYVFDGRTIEQQLEVPVALVGARAAVVDNKIYITGGYDEELGYITTTYVYDFDNGWDSFGPTGEDYTQSRSNHVYVSLGGTVEVITMGQLGNGNNGLFYRTSTTSPWEEHDPNPGPYSHVLVIPWQNGGYLIGGGKYEESYINNGFKHIQRDGGGISYNNISVPAIAGGRLFAHGAGVLYNGIAFAFGLEAYDSDLGYYAYEKAVHVLENKTWKAYPYSSGPIPNESTVLWKVRVSGETKIFGGLGRDESNTTQGLYELKFN